MRWEKMERSWEIMILRCLRSIQGYIYKDFGLVGLEFRRFRFRSHLHENDNFGCIDEDNHEKHEKTLFYIGWQGGSHFQILIRL